MRRIVKALSVSAALLACVARVVNGQGLPLVATCRQEFVAVESSTEEATVILRSPFATYSGGLGVSTVSPVLKSVPSHTGVAGTSSSFTFTVTDSSGEAATCDCVLSVILATPSCGNGDSVCDDPHMQGLRGQKIDWSGEDGAWYSLIKDDDVSLQLNLRLNAPLPDEFPDRQFVTGMSVLSQGHSLVVEVKDPYSVSTDGCSDGMLPCLCDGGLQIAVDGKIIDGLLHSDRDAYVTDGITMSASNLPTECQQFGGDKIWARMYDEMLQGSRTLSGPVSFEEWVLSHENMAAPDWCAKYIAERGLNDVQSTHAVLQIVTPTVVVRLNAGVNHQGGGELDWDGRVLPDLDFWQMDIGLDGLSIDNETLSGILGETARPVIDEDGFEVMEGYDAIRGTVADYKVASALGTDFALLHEKGP